MKKLLFVFSFIILLFCRNGIGQDADCYYVNVKPIKFRQDSLRKLEALEIIKEISASTSDKDSLTLIGVSREEVIDDLLFMLDNPNSTRLNDSGYYCGIVVLLNRMLNIRRDLYVSGVIDLAFYGETLFDNGTKKVKLPQALKEGVDYSVVPSEEGIQRVDIGNISLSDFVLGVSIVNSEKCIQKLGLLWDKSTHRKANVGNFLFANTMPWEMKDFFKIIGIRTVEKKYYSHFENKDRILSKISSSVKSGGMPILTENHLLTADRHKNFFYKMFRAHFLTVHSFEINRECETISLSYWDYGSVKNYREQSVKGSPRAARSLNAAARKAGKLNKIKEGDRYIEITIKQFFKGLKGYWIPI